MQIVALRHRDCSYKLPQLVRGRDGNSGYNLQALLLAEDCTVLYRGSESQAAIFPLDSSQLCRELGTLDQLKLETFIHHHCEGKARLYIQK